MDLLEQLTTALGDRYRIERALGQGGMAVVFLAEDLKHHRRVAIKVLKPELSAVLGSDRFLREIEIAAALQHPHIVPLYDSGQAGGLLYYVMPFADGESLRQRLAREQQLPLDVALAITREVGGAPVDRDAEANCMGRPNQIAGGSGVRPLEKSTGICGDQAVTQGPHRHRSHHPNPRRQTHRSNGKRTGRILHSALAGVGESGVPDGSRRSQVSGDQSEPGNPTRKSRSSLK